MDATVGCAGLILAGGRGRRWGSPKAFARLPDQRRFLEACRDLLAGAGVRPVAATLPHGIGLDELPGLRSLPLPEEGLDMLASLRWGLRHLISDSSWRSVVVLPVDHPLVATDTVVSLAESGAAAAIPVYDGKHGHPVCLSRDVAEQVARKELDGANLRDIIRSVGSVDVSVDDPGIHANCNTPEALKRHLNVNGLRM
jgi:CTP:molybdopterin cytidylyltransferase MocA